MDLISNKYLSNLDTLRIDGRDLFLMQSQDYGRDAPYVVVDESGKEIAADKHGFTEETIEQIRSFLKELEARQTTAMTEVLDKKPKLEVWQQYFENGEYLRAAELTEEQNYNMIDGTLITGAEAFNHRATAGETNGSKTRTTTDSFIRTDTV